ncbi:DUF1273 domain-containing protein [Streptococcus macacae]|uniref:UPF0398 protein STRMA_0062 n=1 Tax=Streptococcus macacae NCTC 11558 TaxID=764298 RepID=G5JY16_9STRE|nr:DUF1273 domain-containing protein [Streptococcus macacae]EHJ52667.1 hypothetical protein STRMA_0062 [Streptococcus macacae NCTC 11558]SUN77934.1 Uncharacterized protein conserved in bacteria [Streptococcus macacae NCTC 11558]
MTTILITGYKSFELGIFQDKDPKIAVLKQVIKKDLIRFIEEGADWFVFMGNLGFEYWALEVAVQLKKEYNIQLATIFPFETHGQKWNESNQEKLRQFKQTDFVTYTYKKYQNPNQLKSYHHFLLDNTDGAYVFYDEEMKTNLSYFSSLISAKEGYFVTRLTFERLNEIIQDFDDNF